MTEWPPEGYEEPNEYTDPEWSSLVAGAVLAAGLFYSTQNHLSEIAGVAVGLIKFASQFEWVAQSSELSLTAVLLAILCTVALPVILLAALVIPVHEWIHFQINRIQGNNPEYVTTESIIFTNPGVVATSNPLSARDYIPGALAPLLVIGGSSLLIMEFSTGPIRGLAASVLIANTAASGTDVVNSLTYLIKPTGVRFANFIEEGEVRSEYAVPEDGG